MNEENHISKEELNNNYKKVTNEIVNIRKRPLLIMFYSDELGEILSPDVDILDDTFKEKLEELKTNTFDELDLIIHTEGGDADSSYRLIQLIRNYCKKLNVIVPSHSFSGGTLITFGADLIEMGPTSLLGPVDVQLPKEKQVKKKRTSLICPIDTQLPEDNEDGVQDFSLLNIEKYLEFIQDCAENVFKFEDEANKVEFINPLLLELVKEIVPTKLGELYRLRTLTQIHAKILLVNYMFRNDSQRLEKAKKIIEEYTKRTPAHDFEMDYSLVKESGLKVKLINDDFYELSKKLIDILSEKEEQDLICKVENPEDIKEPFFDIILYVDEKEKRREN